MFKRYYDLEETTGKIKASYATKQKDIEGLILLEEPPFHPAIYNGTSWEEDVEAYGKQKIAEIRTMLYTSWPDSSKTSAALKAQYDVIKGASSSWTSFAEVDTVYNNWITFMDLS